MKAIDQLAALRTGRLTLAAYVNSICDLIEAEEPALQALVDGTYDRVRVQADVERLLQVHPDTQSRPPLFGLPIGVKDIFRVAGLPTQCGSNLPATLFDGDEASCVTRLKQAGAIVIAKTVTTEFAAFQPGPTVNPHHSAHTPGGSSSGSAAGVSKGFFPFAFGTQTIGSIARPAAYCGVVGFKPSYGRIATDGVIEFSRTMDHVGWLCRDTSALALFASVLIPDWSPRSEATTSSIIGIPEGPYLAQASENELHRFADAALRLQEHGLSIIRCQALQNIEEMRDVHVRLVSAELARVHRKWFRDHRQLYSPKTVALIEDGQRIDDQECEELVARRDEYRRQMTEQMHQLELDYWIAPGTVDRAPLGLDSTGDPIMNLPWTTSGLPTVSIPSGFDNEGLPHGIQLVGRFGNDEQLVQLADTLFGVLNPLCT